MYRVQRVRPTQTQRRPLALLVVIVRKGNEEGETVWEFAVSINDDSSPEFLCLQAEPRV